MRFVFHTFRRPLLLHDTVTSNHCLQGKLYGEKIPFWIFGTATGISSILILTLPETLNCPLPMTMQDAENYEDFVKIKKEAEEISSAGDAAKGSV